MRYATGWVSVALTGWPPGPSGQGGSGIQKGAPAEVQQDQTVNPAHAALTAGVPMPILVASRAAAVRDETPILDRTAETWWSTVRSEINSRREISRLDRPCDSRARTSC